MSGMRVNSDLGASRQRPARASDLSLQRKMDLKATWALIDIQTLKASPCSQPTPYTLPEAKHTGSEEPHWSVPQGAPEA